MSECDLKSANYALRKLYETILWKIDRIEQLEYAASTENRPFREIPRGGFPAHVIGETLWTESKEAWQCRFGSPLGMTLDDTAQLTKKADEYLAYLDEEEGRVYADYKRALNEFTRVFNDF